MRDCLNLNYSSAFILKDITISFKNKFYFSVGQSCSKGRPPPLSQNFPLLFEYYFNIIYANDRLHYHNER